MSELKDLTKKRFGKLIVLKRGSNDKWGRAKWICKCDCGKIHTVSSYHLISKKTKSCSCLKNIGTHKMSHTRFYSIFRGIRSRCNNPNNTKYKDYGGRGVKCLWKTFEDFFKDMHESYLLHFEKHGAQNTSLDRTDNNGNYCKKNCQWVTWKDQQSNKRTSLILKLDGKKKTLTQWSEKLNICDETIRGRLKYGWSIRKALTTPVKK